MSNITWEIRPKLLEKDKWLPEARVIIPDRRSFHYITLTSGDNLLFETKADAEEHSKRLIQKYLIHDLNFK